ncbi:hypothetical protein WJX72_011650 [[Myrmecia] bisecta]|uniref:YqaJ viral recombinase domain-containing protein n=1 Tax=[Myrmecia] bisecta TaxID=41462 RepID=A0AAW1Q587_9CHLO
MLRGLCSFQARRALADRTLSVHYRLGSAGASRRLASSVQALHSGGGYGEPRAPSTSQPAVDVEKVQRALAYESAAGYPNAQGKRRFAEFAAEALAAALPSLSRAPDAIAIVSGPAARIAGAVEASAEEAQQETARVGEEIEFDAGSADLQPGQALARAASSEAPAFLDGIAVASDADVDVASDSQSDESSSAKTALPKRIVNPQTLRFREQFVQTAVAASQTRQSVRGPQQHGQGEQRTAEWRALRDGRLTASAFGNALGFWDEGRVSLWEEKLGLKPAFAGNAATEWGTNSEELALGHYGAITGHSVQSCRFQVLRDDDVHGWLGASPDGLIEGLVASPAAPSPVLAPAISMPKLDERFEGQGQGVLEIKCPFNRGNPASGTPWATAQWYYMPQAQGLMEIFDREWCNLYCWTPNGSAIYHIPRDRIYWAMCFDVLSEFWWAHVIPAKHLLAEGRDQEALAHRPTARHPLTLRLKEYSKTMVRGMPTMHFPALPSQQPLANFQYF